MANKLHLKPRMAKPFWHGEPWIFDGSLVPLKGYKPRDGDFVEIRDSEGRRVGAGFYNRRSAIRVRLLAFGDDDRPPEQIVAGRLDEALALRLAVIRFDPADTDSYRLVHAEGDGLPGLIVDRFGDWLVLQIDCLGLERFEAEIAEQLMAATGARGIYRRVSKAARDEEGSEREEGVLAGEALPETVQIRENGIVYSVDLQRGQKTGFYTDQRDNRRILAGYCRDADFLDAFSYTGSFALNAVRLGGARHACAIDSSGPAMEALMKNAALNEVTAIEPVQGNVLRVLDHFKKDQRQFDVVSLDPPKLVPKKAALRKGLRLYREINEKGIRVLKPGGILATCSCSGAVASADFEKTVAEAAMNTGRRLQLLVRGSQGPDHPERVPHRASNYLKFRVYRVF